MYVTLSVKQGLCSAQWMGIHVTQEGERADDITELDRREKRRRAIITAARSLFLEKGYDAVSLNEIVRHSGGSLSTLYALFENKAGLLGAIVADNRFGGHLRIAALIAGGGPPRQLLRAIAENLHAKFMEAETVGMIRLVMGEALRDPSIARIVYDVAHRPTLDQLSHLFDHWNEHGIARIPDAMLAAEFFMSLVIHTAQTHALFGDPCQRPRPSIEASLDAATALFLNGYGIATENAA